MKSLLVKPVSCLEGRIALSGDKSIAHRYLIISAISQGRTRIKNFPANRDCLRTLAAFRKLGVKIAKSKLSKGSLEIIVSGKGLYGLSKPKSSLLVGDSGTTLRLVLGVLSGQDFAVKLTAGKSLNKRPMLRVTSPLRMMGAQILCRRKPVTTYYPPKTKHLAPSFRFEEYSPIIIKGGRLVPIRYLMPVASAQVKSAILLAGLYASGSTVVIEKIKTRDHTERLLKVFKAAIKVLGNKVVIEGKHKLISPGVVTVPGDVSSASFFVVAATIIPNASLKINHVSLNPSRIGFLKVLARMGADITIKRDVGFDKQEPMGDIWIKSSRLKATTVTRKEIPGLIDELPILMVAACLAEGKTLLKGVGELRFKETDRIISMTENLKKMGAFIRVVKSKESDDIVIQGVKELKGAKVRSLGDHRTAMSLAVCGLSAKGKTLIDDFSCVSKSFPKFLVILKDLIK